jgi:predicted dienelactone hydrolase
MIRLRLLLPILLWLWPPASRAAEQDIALAGRSVTYWSPAPSQDGKLPLLLFSHGFHGCATQSTFLMAALAARGYWVFAPNHRDATCHGGASRWIDRSAYPLRKPELWDAAAYADRAADLRAVIAALRRDPRFADKIDFARLGVIGHSLDGYTVLGLAGAWEGWTMPGVKAVLALSPYSQPFNLKGTMSGLKAPVMFQGGTLDFGITPSVAKTAGSYDMAPPPKYFVDFDGAGHMAWTDLNPLFQAAIIAYSADFLDRYVKGERARPGLTEKGSDVATFRYNSELGHRD